MERHAGTIKMLIYVSSGISGAVQVFDYQTGRRVAILKGFSNTQGECVDAKGDVFIADMGNGQIDEYAHGATKPLKILKTKGAPTACSVAPDGDLAVSNNATASTPGDVAVFAHAAGKPIFYVDKDCHYPVQSAYDHQNNLYFLGQAYSASVVAEVCEIPHGARSMKTVHVNVKTSSPLGAMWDGKHITLSASNYSASTTTVIIYRMKETPAGDLRVVAKTTLTDQNCSGGRLSIWLPFIVGTKNTPGNTQQGTAVVGANSFCGRLGYWAYPRGGDPSKEVRSGLNHTVGQSVSIAP